MPKYTTNSRGFLTTADEITVQTYKIIANYTCDCYINATGISTIISTVTVKEIRTLLTGVHLSKTTTCWYELYVPQAQLSCTSSFKTNITTGNVLTSMG